MRRPLALLASAVALVAQTPPKPPALNLVGAAQLIGDRIRITAAKEQTVGAVWQNEKRQVNAGFETTFRFQLTERGGGGGGADGFAFVLQNSGTTAIAGRGGAGGFALGDGTGNPSAPGIPNSIAIFFDTYRNPDAKDPSNNYIAICTNRTLREMSWPAPRLAFTRKLPFRLNDGREHQARIVYQPPVVRVYLDAREPVLSAAVDLSTVMDGAGRAYVGFTASTGSGYENHDIFNWTFTAVDSSISAVDSDITFLDHVTCLEGRNLCTPKEAVVEETAPGQFHVILPAHLEWGASIVNPSAAPVSLANARGYACWELTAGEEQCGSPTPIDISPADNTLVVPEKKIGVLVIQNDRGRTWFSVNDRKKAFADNQGFFEFDVRLQ